jgi:hypothetical protein
MAYPECGLQSRENLFDPSTALLQRIDQGSLSIHGVRAGPRLSTLIIRGDKSFFLFKDSYLRIYIVVSVAICLLENLVQKVLDKKK